MIFSCTYYCCFLVILFRAHTYKIVYDDNIILLYCQVSLFFQQLLYYTRDHLSKAFPNFLSILIQVFTVFFILLNKVWVQMLLSSDLMLCLN